MVLTGVGLGIEITEYLLKGRRGSPVRELERLRNHLLQKAKEAFATFSNEDFLVTVSWDPHQKFSSKTNSQIAEQIAHTVDRMLAKGDKLWTPNWRTTEGKSLGQHVNQIEIWPGYKARGWVSTEGGTVGGDVRRVQQIIDGKEPHVSRYRETCETVWLLIVADPHLSTYFSPDEDFPVAVFKTSFDRILLFDVFHSEVRILATQSI